MGGYAGLSGLAGLAQGFAQGYAQRKHLELENEMQHRAQLAQYWGGIATNPNYRPEVQQVAAENVLGVLGSSSNLGKPLDKKFSDFSILAQPPPGMGQAQGAALNAGAAATPSVSPAPPQQAIGQAPAAPPLPTPPRQQAPGQFGPPAQFGAAAAPSSLQPPPVNITAQTATVPQLGQLTPPPMSAAGYTPQYTPEERAQQEAYSHGLTAQTDVQAQIEARRRIGESMGMTGDDLARFSLGAAPLISHTQLKAYVTPDAPTSPKYGYFDPLRQTFTDESGQPVPNAQPYEATLQPTTPWRAFMQAGLAEGQPIEQIIQAYNTRYGVSQGVRMEQQPDGSIVAVPVTTTTTSTRGALTPPPTTGAPAAGAQTPGAAPMPTTPGGSPRAGAGAPGRVVGGKIPPEISKAYDTLNASQERLGVMQDALPEAMKGNQQAMLNLLANHIGMTMGLQKGARINQAIYNEALESSPWLARVVAKFDSDGYLSGVVLTPDQMNSMVSLAQDRYKQDQAAYQRTQQFVKSGGKLTPPAGATATGGTVNMRAPNGQVKPVPADQVEHYKSKGAVVVP